MISATQAAAMTADESTTLQLRRTHEAIVQAARKGHHCATVKHLELETIDELQRIGYKIYYDDCDRGTSFYIISWKHTCM
jgi:hypothetical protein